jgi:hypothetical protein
MANESKPLILPPIIPHGQRTLPTQRVFHKVAKTHMVINSKDFNPLIHKEAGEDEVVELNDKDEAGAGKEEKKSTSTEHADTKSEESADEDDEEEVDDDNDPKTPKVKRKRLPKSGK